MEQCCESEPDAKRMRSGREGTIVGYNVPTAVDTKIGLIVHHEVTCDGNDSCQLQPMAQEAKAVLEQESLEVIADSGYSHGEPLDQYEKQGITAAVPTKRSVNSQRSHYQKSAFIYDAEFICPAGELLSYQPYSKQDTLRRYARSELHSAKQMYPC